MKYIGTTAFCILLASLSVANGRALASDTSATATSKHATALDQLGIRPGDAIRYRDEHGKPIVEDDFFNRVAAGHAFSKLIQGKNVILTLQDSRASQSARNQAAPSILKDGDKIPRFDGVTLIGEQVSQSGLAGKTTLMSFFFSQCAPCIAEIPVLNDFARRHKDLNYLAITFDARIDATEFQKKRGFQWPILPEQEDFIESAKITAYPMLILVGPSGEVKAITLTSALAKDGVTGTALDRWYSSNL